MYPECRHVLASGKTCNAPALAKNPWCYFHTRLHQRQSQRRNPHHPYRRADGRFAALPAPHGSIANHHSIATIDTINSTDTINTTDTIDYGPYPVGAPSLESRTQNASIDLPPVEDNESIQLALIDVIQALAANQLDTKRAGLLLYGLQVASINVGKMRLPISAVRTVTYTDEGAPLAPQDYGYDVEDYDDDEEDEDEQELEAE
jgi:hypothetical protein